MLKELLLGMEMLNAIASPTPIQTTHIESKVNNFSNNSNIRIKRNYDTSEPQKSKSLVLMKGKYYKHQANFYPVDPNSNIKPNEQIRQYNSQVKWDIKNNSYDNLDTIYSSTPNEGLYLFSKIIDKQVLVKKEQILPHQYDPQKYTTKEYRYDDSNNLMNSPFVSPITILEGIYAYSYPVFNDVIDANWINQYSTAQYYYSNHSFLNESSSNLKNLFENTNKGKKFLVKKMIFSPQLSLIDPGYSKSEIHLSDIYFNGHKIENEKIIRSLAYIKSDLDLEKNLSDPVWVNSYKESLKQRVFDKYTEGSKILDEKIKLKLLDLGYNISSGFISLIPKMSAIMANVSLIKAGIDVLLFLDNQQTMPQIPSTKEARILNGDILNQFSININEPIAIKWGQEVSLDIFNITLKSKSTHFSHKMKLDDFDVQFLGEWVDDSYYTLISKSMQYETTSYYGGITTTTNLLTGEKLQSGFSSNWEEKPKTEEKPPKPLTYEEMFGLPGL